MADPIQRLARWGWAQDDESGPSSSSPSHRHSTATVQSKPSSRPVERAAPATRKSSATFSLSVQPAPAPLWQSYAFPSAAATVVAPFTNPFAVAKTHLQAKGSRFRGMGDFFRAIAKAEGTSGAMRGIVPVAMREGSMNVFRIGLYLPILQTIHPDDGPAPPWKRMVAGAWSGAIGFFACNPFEMLRVKMMARPLGDPVSAGAMASTIFREEGARGFYKAGGASVALGMVCTSVNLTTYTLFHEAAVERCGETAAVDMSCALASGFLAALAMNPVDVIRTRLWTQGASPPTYRGGFHACATIWKNEGVAALFAGFVPSFLRIGPHFVLTFVLLEQMRRFAKKRNADHAQDAFLTNVFNAIDEDGSGEIDLPELTTAIRQSLPDIGRSDAERFSQDIFDIADEDNSGSIDLEEFLVAGRSSKLQDLLRGQQLRAIFDGLDADKSGGIDEDEIMIAIRGSRKAPGPAASQSEHVRFENQLRRDVKMIMTEMDADGNGSIDFLEFVLAFDKLAALEEKRLLDDCIHGAGVGLASA
ncbi:hypothetical protein ACHAWF_006697 [Thalassiosira exigua]